MSQIKMRILQIYDTKENADQLNWPQFMNERKIKIAEKCKENC